MADDFKEKSEESKKINLKSIGKSGTLVSGFVVQDDYLSELVGVQGQELYAKMLRSDSTIRKLFHAVSNPIRSAVWDIQPASDETADVEAAALIKQILFHDLNEGWTAKLDEILLFPWHGFAAFEVVHQNYTHPTFGPYTGLANLAFRDQRTLDQFKFSPEGILEFVHQIQSGEIPVDIDIPAENMLFFFNEKRGNDLGYPFCRMLYGNYKRKLLYKQLQAIGIERSALAVPHLSLPEGVEMDSDEARTAQEQLEAFTLAENAYFMTPAGYEITFNSTGGFDPQKVQTAIKAENEEIAGSLIGMFLEMGLGGNSAVGSSTGISADFFRDGIEYLANKITETINLKLIPNLYALNFGELPEALPELVHHGIADEAGKELMEVVTGYVKDGVITPDEILEDHVRKAHNLPKKAEGEMTDNGESQDDQSNDPNDPIADDDNDDGDPAQDGDTDEEVELSEKGKPKDPKALISLHAGRVSDVIREYIESASGKYINDVIVRYRQLNDNRKQNATNKTKMGFQSKFKKDLKRELTSASAESISMAKKEIPSKADVELSSKPEDMKRLTEKFGDFSEIKLNDFSSLPTHIQVLIAKQADLISTDSLNELKKRIDFSFSSIETKSSDENVIRQSMEEAASEFAGSSTVETKGTNVSSLMVNEGRNTFFFDDDVLDDIHSFTFVNIAPVSAVCRELAGTTFNTNDAESLRYSPPLHHNCKSYLRANLKSSRGIEKLEVSTLSPSAQAKKSITL